MLVRKLDAGDIEATYEAIEARLAGGERNWLVRMMAVEPSVQGKGVGTQLLNHVLSGMDAEHAQPGPLTVLTTHKPRNVTFYERAGFSVDRAEDVSFVSTERYPVWSMRRRITAPSP